MQALSGIIGRPELVEYPSGDERRWKPVESYLLTRQIETKVDSAALYAKTLFRACESLGVVQSVQSSDEAKEQQGVAAFLKRVEASPLFEKSRVANDLRAQDGRGGIVLASTFATGGLMALLSSGGFGTYVAMSTALGPATATLGNTLPFAAYATASTALSVSAAGFESAGTWASPAGLDSAIGPGAKSPAATP